MKKINFFTLTELCVIIVIGMLAITLLSPLVAKVQDAGSVTKCSENLRQVGGGLLSYCDKNKGVFPKSTFGKDSQGYYPNTWYSKVYKYVEKPEVFLCPAQQQHRLATVKHRALTGLDYEINIEWMGKNKNKIKIPEKTILLAEVGNKCSSSYFFAPWTFSTKAAEQANGIEFRHENFAVVCRADGSVGTINAAELQTYLKDRKLHP